MIAREVIRPHDHLAADAGVGGVGRDAGIRTDHCLSRCGHVTLALVVTANQHGTATGGTRSVDLGMAEEAYAITQNLHGSPGLSRAIARHIDPAGDHRVTAGGPQGHDAVALDNAIGADHARMVHSRSERAAQRSGHQCHCAAVSLDAAGIDNAGAQRGFVDRIADQAVAHHVQVHARTGEQGHRTAICGDSAAVGDLRCGEHHVAARCHRDAPVVVHRTAAAAAEAVLAGVEIAV